MRIISLTDGIELSGNPPSGIIRMKIVDVASVGTATAYAMSATAAIVTTQFGLLYRSDVRTRQVAYNQWMVEVPYAAEGVQRIDTGDWSWDFDTSGATIHITQAKQEVARYPSATAPDQKGAIAVNNGEVQGAEIVIPAMRVNVNFRHPEGVMTLPRAKYLSSITGTVNSATFLTFEPGEVLFLGARGGNGSSTQATVTYMFAMSANSSGQTIGDITGVAKKGWELAWIRYRDDIVTADSEDRLVRVPQYVYVCRVYDDVDFAVALGFGG